MYGVYAHVKSCFRLLLKSSAGESSDVHICGELRVDPLRNMIILDDTSSCEAKTIDARETDRVDLHLTAQHVACPCGCAYSGTLVENTLVENTLAHIVAHIVAHIALRIDQFSPHVERDGRDRQSNRSTCTRALSDC